MKWETILRPVKKGLGSIGSDLNFVLHEMSWNQSEKFPTSSLRFSLLKNDHKQFFDILESFQCAIQLIFEFISNIPHGTMWKIGMKLGQKPA